MLVKVITPSNAAIFPEYIIPSIEHLASDPEVSVRSIYAQCMAPFADTALRYLEMGQALKAHGAFKLSADVQEYDEAQVEVWLALLLFCQRLIQFYRSPMTPAFNTFKRALRINCLRFWSTHHPSSNERYCTTSPRCVSSSGGKRPTTSF